MAAQATDEERRAVATHLLDNGGTREDLDAQVDDPLGRPPGPPTPSSPPKERPGDRGSNCPTLSLGS